MFNYIIATKEQYYERSLQLLYLQNREQLYYFSILSPQLTGMENCEWKVDEVHYCYYWD